MASNSNIPNSLQAGGQGQNQPPPQPTLSPYIDSNHRQYTLPTRIMSQIQPPSSSHSYSRSSPAGLQEQKYTPFTVDTPDMNKYPQTPQQKYYNPNNAQSIQSPLNLEAIRPRANSSLNDDSAYNEMQATNSNYIAPWAVFAFDWCKYPTLGGNSAGKIAIGSYLEDPHNFIQIIDTQISTQDNGIEYTRIAEATCSYPVTRILWEPPLSQKTSTDLLATSGDHLRLWSLPGSVSSTASNTITRSSAVNTRDQPPQKLTPLALLSNSKSPEHTAPLTSLDWNQMSPKLIITSSIDTTCTIWDIPTLTAKTQLIAHDKEVYDVRFCAGSVDVFVSCGADGSVRMFDLRSLEHSTIIYEPSEKQPSDAKVDSKFFFLILISFHD
jgi:WD repeat-containing protein 68